MPPSNPFRPAEQVAPKVKVLIFGASGVGKTYFALTAPGKVAIIDTEGGTAFYARRAGKAGLSQFDVLPTKTYRDVQSAVEYIVANPTAYGTLVIDPVTVIYETLQDAAQVKRADKRHDPDADLEMLDWQQIKRRYKSLMTALVNLPIHVIVTAREKDETERKGSETVKIGVKPDAEKGTAYFFDTVIRLAQVGTDSREAQILKDRTGTHPLGARLPAPSFKSVFGAAIRSGKEDTAERAVQDDEGAAQADARAVFGMVEDATLDQLSGPTRHVPTTDECQKAAVAKGVTPAAWSELLTRTFPDRRPGQAMSAAQMVALMDAVDAWVPTPAPEVGLA